MSFDLTPFIVKVKEVPNQVIEDVNNFDAYIGKVRKLVKEAGNKFSFAREFCGFKDGSECCRNERQPDQTTYCKLENCPLLK